MAITDKNIVITPNTGNTSDPKIAFTGANSSVGAQTVNMIVYPASNGTLSFEGNTGQLFSITNDLSGTVFRVNDISGLPSISVEANGMVGLATFGGSVRSGGVFWENATTINSDYTVVANVNAMSAGPIAIANGVTVTISNNSVWTVV